MMLFLLIAVIVLAQYCDFKFKWNKKKAKTKIVRSINYETITKCSCHRLLLHHQCYFLQMLQLRGSLKHTNINSTSFIDSSFMVGSKTCHQFQTMHKQLKFSHHNIKIKLHHKATKYEPLVVL